jgi:hypothetical protein
MTDKSDDDNDSIDHVPTLPPPRGFNRGQPPPSGSKYSLARSNRSNHRESVLVPLSAPIVRVKQETVHSADSMPIPAAPHAIRDPRRRPSKQFGARTLI